MRYTIPMTPTQRRKIRRAIYRALAVSRRLNAARLPGAKPHQLSPDLRRAAIKAARNI